MPATCTRCHADCAPDSDLCHAHHAERARFGEHPAACICWGCAKNFPQNTGLLARYRAVRAQHASTVTALHAVVFAAAERAEQGAVADAHRAAWIEAVEIDAAVAA